MWCLAMLGLALASDLDERPTSWDLADLRAQVEAEPWRRLPTHPKITAAIDAHLFYRTSVPVGESPGYYHGGYWVDGRVEYRPFTSVDLGLRLTALNPAASYGIVSKSRLHHWFHGGWHGELGEKWPLRVEGHYFDLGRRTLGAGLTLHNKEMAGASLDVAQNTTLGEARLRFIFDGTGGFDIAGDLLYLQADFADDWVGAYGYTMGTTPLFWGVYAQPRWGPFAAGLELGSRNHQLAALGRLEARVADERFSVNVSTSFRWFEDGYIDGIAIEHDYLSVEQEDRDLTDPMNFFSAARSGWMAGARVRAEVHLHRGISLFADDEVTRMHDGEASDFWLHRHGVRVRPWETEAAWASIWFGNRYSAAVGTPTFQHQAPSFTFADGATVVGLEARMSL